MQVDVGHHQVPQTRLEFGGMERREAEVVEELVAVFEFAELGASHQQQHRGCTISSLADPAEERPASLGVACDVDDCSRPPPGGSPESSTPEAGFHE